MVRVFMSSPDRTVDRVCAPERHGAYPWGIAVCTESAAGLRRVRIEWVVGVACKGLSDYRNTADLSDEDSVSRHQYLY